MVQKLVSILKQIDPRDPYRIEMTDMLLEKLWVLFFFFKKKNGAFFHFYVHELDLENYCNI